MTANAYLDSLDIANRACVHLGVSLIESIDEDSQRNRTITEVYDKLRQDELRRNQWVFAKRKVVLRAIDSETRVLNPAAWQENTLYLPGSVVAHTNGSLWHSVMSENRGNEPGATDAWDSYYGPMSVHKWDSETSYYPGEVVYVEQGDPGQYVLYISKTNGNTDDPTDGAEWDADTTYQLDDTVLYHDRIWRSVLALNKGIIPSTAPADWSAETTYAINDTIVAADGMIYTSTANDNINYDPLDATNGFWTATTLAYAWNAVPITLTTAQSWFPIYAGLKNMSLDFLGLNLGAGPVSFGNAFAVNTFMLPSGFLRELRLYTKFAAPGNDRERVGNFITSIEPILLFPFCADITNVRAMDPMFCEGLAARIGFEVCETLTQSRGKKQDVVSAYRQFMTEARIINAIEAGPEEPDEDTFISVRRMGFPWQIG